MASMKTEDNFKIGVVPFFILIYTDSLLRSTSLCILLRTFDPVKGKLNNSGLFIK